MVKKSIYFLLVFSFFFYNQKAMSQTEKVSIVLFNLFSDNVKEKDMIKLNNCFERELDKLNVFEFVDRSNIDTILDMYGVEQNEVRTVPWMVRIGKKLKVDKVVFGSVNINGSNTVIHVRTVNIKMGKIDFSVSEVCKNCSIDVILKHKMKSVAHRLTGQDSKSEEEKSLFEFAPGPLIKLDSKESDSSMDAKMGSQIFQEWERTKIKRINSFGILFFSLGTTIYLLNNVVWAVKDHPPDSKERLPAIFMEMSFGFLAIPFFLKAVKSKRKVILKKVDFLRNNLEFGVKAGVAKSRLNLHKFEKTDTYLPKTGILFGGFIANNFNPFFSFQSEVLFIQKGIKEIIEKESIISLDYLEFPLLLKSMFPIRKKARINLVLGLSPTLLLTSNKELTNKKNNEISEIDKITRFDLGLHYCIEFDWRLKAGTINLEFKNIEGFVPLGNYWNSEEEPTNRIFSFLVGYNF